jgi:hypothetical protein
MILKNMPPRKKETPEEYEARAKRIEAKPKPKPKKKAEPFPLTESQEIEMDFDWLMDGDLDSENPRLAAASSVF